jgi:hypothetical protein
MDCPACESAKGLQHRAELRQHLSIANLVERVEKLEEKQAS